MDFSSNKKVLPIMALTRGPDVLRPRSVTSRYGSGKTAFFYTRYPYNKAGDHIFEFPASQGHEKHINNPELLQGFFGPNLDEIKPKITYTKPIYDDNYKQIGEEEDYDHWKVRELAQEHSIIGRYGSINKLPVLMLWNIPKKDGWSMLYELVNKMDIPDDTIVVHLTSELGTVGKFKEVFRSKKKSDGPKQDKERWEALARYHTATGVEKDILQKKYGFGKEKFNYPDTSKMSDEEIEDYPWKRWHWKKKADDLGIPGIFDYGESKLSFSNWLNLKESGFEK